jgi:hypothetical protein
MSRYNIAIYDPIKAQTIATYTSRLRPDSLSLTDAACSFEVPLPPWESVRYLDNQRVLQIWVTRHGRIRKYRLATPTLLPDGVRFESAGLVVALDDDDYTDLWSSTDLGSWLVMNPNYNSRYGENWTIDTNNRLFLGMTNNATYPNNAGYAGAGFFAPAGGTRPVAVAQFDVAFVNIPANFRWQMIRGNRDFTGLATQTFLLSPGTSTYAFCQTLTTPMDLIAFELFNLTGAPALYVGETGASRAVMTNVRVATSVANLVSTTVTSGAIAIGVASPTVASVANLYVGQRVVINSGAADSESVVITAVGATTLTAVFAKNHLAGATVRAIYVSDKEIIEHALSQVTTLNTASGLRTSTALIQSSGRDLADKQWSAASPLAVISELAARADYSYGVRPDGALYYHPRGTYSRAWSVRAGDIVLARPAAGLVNSVRARYESNDRAAVTAYSSDTASIVQNGLTRRRTIGADTGSATEAGVIRDTSLGDTKTRKVQSSITFRRLFDRGGVEYPPDSVQPGDTITIANLPAGLTGSNLRTFTVAEAAFDPVTSTPSVTPQEPLPRLDVLLAQGISASTSPTTGGVDTRD